MLSKNSIEAGQFSNWNCLLNHLNSRPNFVLPHQIVYIYIKSKEINPFMTTAAKSKRYTNQ